MNFPVFGDAETNAVGGKACAALIQTGLTIWSCPDRDPLGKVAYFTAPYLLAQDPIIIEYLTLSFKILAFLLFIAGALRVQRLLVSVDCSNQSFSHEQMGVGTLIVCLMLLALCLGNIPIRLTDMEAACCAMLAIGFALIGLKRLIDESPTPFAHIFLTCLFMNFAGLFKISFFVHQALMITALALCLPSASLRRLLFDWRVYALVIAGNFGIWLQLLLTWQRYATIGLTPQVVMDMVATARQYPNVALEIYTIPDHEAYLLQVSSNISRISWWVYKLYYAIFVTDPFVYGGIVQNPRRVAPDSLGYWVKVYLAVAAAFAFFVASVTMTPRPVRFVTLTGLFILLFMAAYQHIEPRYFIFPKALFGLVALYWLSRGWEQLQIWAERQQAKRFQ